MWNTKQWFGTCVVAATAGSIGVVAGTTVSRAADQKAAGSGHAYGTTMKEQVAMFRGADGAVRAKETMLKMAAHQYLLGELSNSDDVEALAQSPDIKKAVEQVKATLKDHAKLDEQKTTVANKGDEVMMVIAHALLNQDAEASAMLMAAEAGKHRVGVQRAEHTHCLTAPAPRTHWSDPLTLRFP